MTAHGKKRRGGSRQASHEPSPDLKDSHAPTSKEPPFYYLRSASKESLERLFAPKLSGTVDLLALHGLSAKYDQVADKRSGAVKITKGLDPTIKTYAANLLTFNLDPWLKQDVQPAPPKPQSLMQVVHSDFSTAGVIKQFDKYVMDTALRLRKGDNSPIEEAFPLPWLGGKEVIPVSIPAPRPKIVIKASSGKGPLTPRTAMESAILTNPALSPIARHASESHVSPMAGKRRLSSDEFPDAKRHKH